jgi:hypothetical protein
MDSSTQLLTIMILLLALVVGVIATQFVRRRRTAFDLRDIPAYTSMPMMVGAAIEANRPLHLSPGSAGLAGNSTLLALASAELFYQVSQRSAISNVSPILTVSDTTAIALGHDTLRRAYQSRNLVERYRRGNVRWFPSGTRSLAFAAALTATMGDDNVGANFMVGSFGPELALIADAAYRRNQSLIAASDQLEGQAVAFAVSDKPLIGEEIFVAGAYLGGESSQVGSVITQDVLRWLLVGAIIVTAVLSFTRGG